MTKAQNDNITAHMPAFMQEMEANGFISEKTFDDAGVARDEDLVQGMKEKSKPMEQRPYNEHRGLIVGPTFLQGMKESKQKREQEQQEEANAAANKAAKTAATKKKAKEKAEAEASEQKKYKEARQAGLVKGWKMKAADERCSACGVSQDELTKHSATTVVWLCSNCKRRFCTQCCTFATHKTANVCFVYDEMTKMGG